MSYVPAAQGIARSFLCPCVVAQKFRVRRETVIDHVKEETGVWLHEPKSGEELVKALGVLEALKKQDLD